jgi:hypothetical protein
MLITPWVNPLSGEGLLASVFCMAALGRILLSKAYSFTVLGFPMILLCSRRLFRNR